MEGNRKFLNYCWGTALAIQTRLENPERALKRIFIELSSKFNGLASPEKDNSENGEIPNFGINKTYDY